MKAIQLDLISFQAQLRLSTAGETTYIFDPIRKKEVVLTPEELLRQLLLQYLLLEKGYPAHRIRSEVGIELNGLKKRCDIVVYDADVQPWMVIECKSPKVAITQAVFEQASRYNLQLKAPYLAVSNGLATYCCTIDFEHSDFSFLDSLPDFGNR